ncbi:hypothetical protein [Propionispora hippei]|uniref:Uncharacterized protein n=1 Tax=Propionispora hippei DSM 15287 TaxID=1123003 RepID=A0A1M6F5K0_9FIRM|nr:hypothetical protein [Propionispora hippei]SHI92869.1 hypothetical protein SAMN02745170_01371 [Propionispora hippei DSM 15287]
MTGFICLNCNTWLSPATNTCPGCQQALIYEGETKNILDRLEPNCLINRYDGSDLLEPAVFLKCGRSNAKVATKLQEYAKPVVIPKQKVYHFNQQVLSSIQALRNERTAAMMRYEQLIQNHWQQLKPYPYE